MNRILMLTISMALVSSCATWKTPKGQKLSLSLSTRPSRWLKRLLRKLPLKDGAPAHESGEKPLRSKRWL